MKMPNEVSEDYIDAVLENLMAAKFVDAPTYMFEVSPRVVVAFAVRNANKNFGDLPLEDRKLLARIGRCRYSCELYIEAKARVLNKKVIYVEGGVPLEPMSKPDTPTGESTDQEGSFL
ncbi:MAG TPA: hypothetical protein VHE55_16000 [Fimbriimonadaceae bacterium]|nr:hypothetical protein [Fimbriimonadaceae bacterium]